MMITEIRLAIGFPHSHQQDSQRHPASCEEYFSCNQGKNGDSFVNGDTLYKKIV